MTTRSLLLRDPALLTESQWASVVNDTARLGGWRRYHTYLSKRSPRGFPDLVLVRDGRLIFAELKTEAKTSKATQEQDEWLAALRDVAGVEVYLWRPSDWSDVVEVLTGHRPRESARAA